MALHQELSGTEIHTPFAFVYATEAARTGATGLTSNDEQKLALQTSDSTVWVLTNFSGPTWARVGKYDNASELLTAIKTVDGSGSGLDADKLDGYEASALLHTSVETTCTPHILATGTFTVPTGIYTLPIFACGGGGGGAYWYEQAGSNGGPSSFGSLITAGGGHGGYTSTTPGEGGTAPTSGVFRRQGTSSYNTQTYNGLSSLFTEYAEYGKGGHGYYTSGNSSGSYGGGGGAGYGVFNVIPGKTYTITVGGGGASGGVDAAYGATGCIVVWY